MERFQDKSASQPEPGELVGPYLLLTEIGRGELTTVYLAKKNAALGLRRLYALKRLRPAVAHNADSIELLLDEARLVSGIHHANIAGVLDVGNANDIYTVMEYVEGENLDALLTRASTARHPRFVVPVFVDALNGLHALHTASDADGECYGLVHQAPRARHIVVGIDGNARLVDFSQVRGRYVRPTRSRSDRIKVAYMAPEQALHPDGVDLRSDLFIVGIALWEALTGERLFAADTDEQTFQNMLHRRIPRPSEVGLRPPRCFDAICMRALERAPKNRYPSAQEMARDLHDTAINQALYATANEVGQWVRQLAGSDLRKLRKLAGQDYPSGSISLETPAAGIDLATGKAPVGLTSGRQPPASSAGSGVARLSDGLTALRGADERPMAQDPYGTGHIYGGSSGQVELDAREQAPTPAVGFKRGKPLPREEADDEPTGQRMLARAEADDQRARAPTEPQSTPALLERAALAGAPGNQASSAFVPARPGARRDTSRPSPGAYSQVDPARRAKQSAPVTELEIPTSKVQLVKEKVVKESSVFDEADTTVHPQLAPKEESHGGPDKRTETQSYESARFGGMGMAAPATSAERRSPAITEHPPTYVQRRDSSPTRMEIPEGPVGNPLGPFSPEHAPLGATYPPRSADPFDLPLLSPVDGALLEAPDSLSPPRTAERTAPPPASASRPSALWLVSGVLAAIILLAVGVGLKQWVAGGPTPRTGVSHAAGARSASGETTLRAEPTASPSAVGDTPATEVPGATAIPPVNNVNEVAPAAPVPRSAGKVATPRNAVSAPSAGAEGVSGEPKPARPKRQAIRPSRPEPLERKRERASGGLPDNPY